MENVVYWICHDEYDYPESDLWTNDLYCVKYSGSYVSSIEMALETLTKNSPTHYVVITDFDSIYRRVLGNKFISNNIIDIKNVAYDKEKVRKQIGWIMSDFGKNKIVPEQNVWFISDSHFSHRNIIKYCNRPWHSGKDENGNLVIADSDVERMNKMMIDEWNSVVKSNDQVFHLGDFALGDRSKILEIRKQLNGKISLILGNHDWFHIRDKEKYSTVVDFFYKSGFEKVYDKPIVYNDFMILSHEPMTFVKAPFFNVFGHVHDCETYKTWSKDSCCVCVERHEYKPVSLKEIKRHYDELNSEKY